MKRMLLVCMTAALALQGCAAPAAQPAPAQEPAAWTESVPEADAELAAAAPPVDMPLADIRAQLPWQGLREAWREEWLQELPLLLPADDPVGAQLQLYADLYCIGPMEIASPGALGDSHVLGTAIRATQRYATDPQFPGLWLPELEPLAAQIYQETGSSTFWLEEHVEQSLRLLYGGLTVDERRYSAFDQHLLEALGVYFQPPRGGGHVVFTVVLGYEDLGDRYRAEVAHVQYLMGGFVDPGTGELIAVEGQEGAQDLLRDHLLNRADRYHLTLRRQGDGLVLEQQVRAA